MSEEAPDRWERLERLYHGARERPPAERAAFLAEACGADTTLRRDLESLLSQDHGDGLLETPLPKSAESPINTSGVAPFPDGTLRVYEIQGHIGAGGMGEVYRARDTTLGRDVAIKVLPRSVSDDPDRRARFEREARLLAALNHPHIAQVYGFEEFDGGHALVMEFVEGDTLDKVIGDRKRRSGALPIARALALGRQIADALDAAHEKGIVHRDLKPSNIKVTPAGTVKVLDFGLAKAVEPVVAVAAITTEVSRHPVILGTIPYMSPEQARGEPVDKRADIWAFGCVLFEMLAGRAPFEGDTASDTLFRILSRDPEWAKLPAETPASVRTLLDRCLRKDPRQRLHDIADARIELDDVERSAGTADVPARPAATRRERLAWLISAVLVVLLAVTILPYRRQAPATVEPIRVPIDGPPSPVGDRGRPSEFAISPDGRQVTVAASSAGTSVLWVRSVAGSLWHQLDGTEDAINPFWKPDGQAIGFFTRKTDEDHVHLKTVRIADGSVTSVCDVPTDNPRPSYGAWSSRGVILFSGDVFLRQVPEGGGNSTPVTQGDPDTDAHRSPSFLPDGDHFLYLAQTGSRQTKTTSELRVGSISPGKTVFLGPFDSNAIYASGYLLFVQRGGRLVAQSFDTNSLKLRGEPQTLAEDVHVAMPWLRAQFSVSTTGRLTYSQAVHAVSELTWYNQAGRVLGTVGEAGQYTSLNLNHDDSRLLVTRIASNADKGIPSNGDIWVMDLARGGVGRPLTVDEAAETDPAWSHDEGEIVFTSFDIASIHGRDITLFRRSSNGTGENVQLVKTDPLSAPGELSAPEWSPDGRVLMFAQAIKGTKRGLWTIGAGDRTPKPFLNTKFNEASGAFSPDDNGRWIAYESADSGHPEIYACRFPEADMRTPISTKGGHHPRWSRDGSEIFFLAPDGMMMAAAITKTATALQAADPEMLFRTGLKGTPHMHPYAVTKDGRFLMPVLIDSRGPAPATVLLDWLASLTK